MMQLFSNRISAVARSRCLSRCFSGWPKVSFVNLSQYPDAEGGTVRVAAPCTPAISDSSKLGRGVGTLNSSTGDPFLCNIPLSLLGLDERSKQYRAVSLMRWQDVVSDPQFTTLFPIRQTYRPEHARHRSRRPGRPRPASHASQPRPPRQTAKRETGPPAGAASPPPTTTTTPSTTPTSTAFKFPGLDPPGPSLADPSKLDWGPLEPFIDKQFTRVTDFCTTTDYKTLVAQYPTAFELALSGLVPVEPVEPGPPLDAAAMQTMLDWRNSFSSSSSSGGRDNKDSEDEEAAEGSDSDNDNDNDNDSHDSGVSAGSRWRVKDVSITNLDDGTTSVTVKQELSFDDMSDEDESSYGQSDPQVFSLAPSKGSTVYGFWRVCPLG